VVANALRSGNIELVARFHRLGIITPAAYKAGQKYTSSQVMELAVESGSLELVTALYSVGYKCPIFASNIAAECGHTHILEWMVANKIQLSRIISLYAAKEPTSRHDKHLEVLGLLHRVGALTSQAYEGAAQTGNILVMSRLYAVGHKPTTRSTYYSALRGDKRALAWLLDHGASWDPEAVEAAVAHGPTLLDWMMDRGAVWSPDACIMGILKGHRVIVAFADWRKLPYDSEKCNELLAMLGSA
jgi:hypothetical protein